MHKNKVLLIIIIAIISIQTAISQNNTNSPYTRFGYGQLSDNTSGEQRAMGGVAIGARSPHRINTINPASYSVSDSLTFMFDLGVSAMLTNFSDNELRRNSKFNGNLEYLSMQFRLFKGVGMSAGVQPYSYAGYNFYSTDSVPMPGHSGENTMIKYTDSYVGSGGINQFYVGLSFDLFNHFSLGANMYYMFGNYTNSGSKVISASGNSPTNYTKAISISDTRFRFGLQYHDIFADKHELTIGAIYEPKVSLNNAQATSTHTSHIVEIDTLSASDFDIPQSFGVGLYYKYNNKWSVGVDYSMQQWGDANFYGPKNDLIDSWKLAAGLEYQPNYRGRKFGDRIMYRVGANMSSPYYTIGGQNPEKNLGLSLGIGFPLQSTSRTMLNMAFEYSKIGPSEKLKEDYFKFTFNFSLAETWFFKRKL